MPDDERLVDAWRRLAINEFPHAAQFPELVTGKTEEEIRTAAETVHNRVAAMVGGGAQDTFAQARQTYGPSATTGGGGFPPSFPSNRETGEERWNMQFAERFNNAPRDAYGQRMGIGQDEIKRYTNNRFIGHVRERLAMWADLTRSDAGYRRRA